MVGTWVLVRRRRRGEPVVGGVGVAAADSISAPEAWVRPSSGVRISGRWGASLSFLPMSGLVGCSRLDLELDGRS